MKIFGLFQSGSPEPIKMFEAVMTVMSGTEVTLLGERGEDGRRAVIAVVQLQPGQTLHKLNPWRQ
jgi:hypothetical protein